VGTDVKEPWITQERNPRKRPVFPGTRYSTNPPLNTSISKMGSNHGVKLFAFAYRIFPISKPISPVVWIATNHGDKGVGDEPYHKEDLEDGKVKLGSSKIPDREPVEPTTTLRLALSVRLGLLLV
jgi:hypothetical protein